MGGLELAVVHDEAVGSSSTLPPIFVSSSAMHVIRSVSLDRAWGTLTSLVVPSAKAAVTAIAGRASGVSFMSIVTPLSWRRLAP